MFRASVDHSTNSLCQGLGAARRHRDTCIGNKVGALPNIGYDTRNATRHGVSDGVGESLAPGGRTSDVEGRGEAGYVRSLAEQKGAALQLVFGDKLQQRWLLAGHPSACEQEVSRRVGFGHESSRAREADVVFHGMITRD